MDTKTMQLSEAEPPKLKPCPICKDTPIPIPRGGNGLKGYKCHVYCGHHWFLSVEGNGNTEENSKLGAIEAWNKAVNTLVKWKGGK